MLRVSYEQTQTCRKKRAKAGKMKLVTDKDKIRLDACLQAGVENAFGLHRLWLALLTFTRSSLTLGHRSHLVVVPAVGIL